jgi:mannose-6-phosphate isomerase-like protein (cupin superfamily)
MKREIKVWGERWLIREDSTHAVSYLIVHEGYRCSWHVHDEKYNLFVIVSGEIRIRVEELGKIRDVILSRGETFTIKPGQYHEFQGETDAEVIEEMYVEYKESDIHREIKGSRI